MIARETSIFDSVSRPDRSAISILLAIIVDLRNEPDECAVQGSTYVTTCIGRTKNTRGDMWRARVVFSMSKRDVFLVGVHYPRPKYEQERVEQAGNIFLELVSPRCSCRRGVGRYEDHKDLRYLSWIRQPPDSRESAASSQTSARTYLIIRDSLPRARPYRALYLREDISSGDRSDQRRAASAPWKLSSGTLGSFCRCIIYFNSLARIRFDLCAEKSRNPVGLIGQLGLCVTKR